MNRLTHFLVLASIGFLAIGASARASGPANCVTPVEQHPWGHFQPGSWKRVRVTQELLGEGGQVESQSITETETKLETVRDCEFVLRIEVTVEIAGKRFVAQPQYVTQGINGEVSGQTAALKSVGAGEILIDGRSIPCEIKQVTIEDKTTRRTSTLYYASDVAPYLLKRSTVATDPMTKEVKYKTNVETLAVAMPYRVRNELMSTAWIKTTHRHEDGEIVTVETHCEKVPGGVVAHTSKEMDRQGRLTRRSTLELVDYEIAEDAPLEQETKRRPLFRRRDRRN